MAVLNERKLKDRLAKLESELSRVKATVLELERRKALFEAIFNDVPDAMVVANPEREIQLCNPALTKTFGYAPEEILGKKTKILYESEKDFEAQGELRFNLESSEKLKPYIVNYRRKNGEIFPGETVGTVIRDKHGLLLGYLGLMRDVTERRQGEEALRKSYQELEQRVQERTGELEQSNRKLKEQIEERRRLEQALRAVAEGTTRYVGERFFRNLVQRLAAVLQVKYALVSEIIGHGDRARTLAIVADGKLMENFEYDLTGTPCAEMLRGRICYYCDGVRERFPTDGMLAKTGAEMYMGTPLFDHTGTRPLGLLSVLDVKPAADVPLRRSLLEVFSDRAAAELERILAEREKAKLEVHLRHSQKMEAIGTLAGGIAHDFNNILHAIQGYTELTLLEVPQAGKAAKYLKKIEQSAQRATDLVKQILVFSRRNDDQKRQPLQLGNILRESLQFIRGTIPTTIEIKQHIDPACPSVLADLTQIHQVIINLCTNAADAMRPEGGVLNVFLQPAEVDASLATRLEGVPPGPYVQLTVEDTGHGMDKETVHRIFDPYFTTKEIGKGTGLGLAIVHGIVKSYGGGIMVESRPGRGSSFHVYLPATEQSGRAEPEAEGLEVRRLCGNVLFVDDEEDLAQLAEEILSRLGCEVRVFTDSLEAMAAFREDPGDFDVVITDQTMPNLTGMELARAVLSLRPEIPVILTTGYSEYVDEKRAKSLGIEKFLMKPLTLRDLADAVSQAIGQKASRHKQ